VRRWFCDEKQCSRGSFTDSVAAVPARSRLTHRLGSEAGQRVVDGTCAIVVAAGRQLGLSWPTVMEAVREQAEVSLPPEREPVGVLGIDEVRRGRPTWRPKGDGQPAEARTAPWARPARCVRPVQCGGESRPVSQNARFSARFRCADSGWPAVSLL
jgi:hypothetical protein